MSDETEVVNPPAVFSGQAFSEARQRLELSIQQVARQLHLPEAVIHSIEGGELDKLKDPFFSRGYIRAYARFLKLDADALVAAYNQQTGNLSTTAQVRAIGSVSTAPGRRHGHPVLKVGTWVFILVLIAVSIWWSQTQFGFDAEERSILNDLPVSVETTDGTTLLLPPVSDLETEAEVSARVDSQSVNESADETSEVPQESVESVSQSANTTTAETESQSSDEKINNEAESGQPEPSVHSGLSISLVEDCWLSIEDALGRTLYSGVAAAGSVLEFEGDEPLSVVIGRVSAVADLRYNNEPIELAAISKDNVARLSLPL